MVKPTLEEARYLYRSQAKAGTTSFFAYATVYVIRAHQRVTLAIHAIPRGETLVASITYLLARLTPLRVKVKRLYLDRGFYCVPVIRWLKALTIPFLMPGVIRGKHGGTRALCKGRTSYLTQYTLYSQQYGLVDCQMAVVCRYRKGLEANTECNTCCSSSIVLVSLCTNCLSTIALALGLRRATDSKISAAFAPPPKIRCYVCCLWLSLLSW